MQTICLTLHIHLPAPLKHYSFFDIGESSVYEDDVKSFELLDQAATTHILPALRTLSGLITTYPDDFHLALSLCGSTLDLLERFRPDVLELFQKLAATGNVEFVCGTYHHSLACVLSMQEFREQALSHRNRIHALFGQTPMTFRNTGLIYSDPLAGELESLGFTIILAGGAKPLLGRMDANPVFRPAPCATVKVLVNNTLLAQSPTRWMNWEPNRTAVTPVSLDLPMTQAMSGARTDVQEFLDDLPGSLLSNRTFRFRTPAQLPRTHKHPPCLTCADWVSDEPPGYDLTPWMGNEMQKDALNALYLLEQSVKGHRDPSFLKTWRKLQQSDHFYQMSTRPSPGTRPESAYMPYASPYDAYINFMNILTDFSERLGA